MHYYRMTLEPMCSLTAIYNHWQLLLQQFGFFNPNLHSAPRAYCLSAMLAGGNIYHLSLNSLSLIVSSDSLVISSGKEHGKGVNFYFMVCQNLSVNPKRLEVLYRIKEIFLCSGSDLTVRLVYTISAVLFFLIKSLQTT